MAKTLFHDGDVVVFVPGHHGRPHLPAHVQMMVQAPPPGMTGHVVDTYHDAAQVRWDDGMTTVVHALDLNRMHGARMVHNNPSHGRAQEPIFGNGDLVTFVPRKHGKPHLPAQVQMMVQAPRRVGMTGIVVDTYHDAAQVQWDDGTMTVVHQMDLGASDFQGMRPGEMMHNNPAFHEYGRESARKGENHHWREGTKVTFSPRGWIQGFYSQQHLNALPPPHAPGRVVSVMAGGRHSTTAGNEDSWVYVEWPNGAIVPVAEEDLTRR